MEVLECCRSHDFCNNKAELGRLADPDYYFEEDDDDSDNDGGHNSGGRNARVRKLVSTSESGRNAALKSRSFGNPNGDYIRRVYRPLEEKSRRGKGDGKKSAMVYVCTMPCMLV